MKQFNGYEAKKATARETLPAGGYVAKVMDAKEVEFDWGNQLQISFDIVEGEYKDFFAKDYRNNVNEDKKWRGVYRLTIPRDDGSERDNWSKRTFNNMSYAFEQSNPGYHWDWNENSLKGKLVGVLFRNKEWEMNGRSGWTTECGGLTEIEEIRNGTYKMLKDKPLEKPNAFGYTSNSYPGGGFIDFSGDDSDLPF